MSVGKDVEKLEPSYIAVGVQNVQRKCKIVQPLQKTVWQFLDKLNIELSYDPAVPLLGIHPK